MNALLPEIAVDSFAGGGGASKGIEQAMRRMQRLDLLPEGVEPIVNIAINHDSKALAMHAANHPATLHLPCDIWTADPLKTVGKHPVGLLWASPDCRHHSKAKGGRPVSDSVRSLANVIVNWAELVRPRIIMLENVEEFRDWGPLIVGDVGQARPCKVRKGELFKAWVQRFRRLGYKVDWRESRACNRGAPTIRKRLFVIMRCDGEPILWPPQSHDAPDSADVLRGASKPWRTAAEIIDWDLHCPSILMTKEEGKAYTAATGKRVIRPTAENTERRVAKGVERYVLDAEKPFIVTCNHSGERFRGQGLDAPFATVTKARDGHGLVVPHIMTLRNAGKPHTATDEPTHTVTAGGAGLSLVNAEIAPFAVKHTTGGIGFDLGQPCHTVTASRKDTNAIIAAHMISLKGSTRRVSSVEEPHATITAGGQHSGVVTASFIKREFGRSVGSTARDPVGTITAGGSGKTQVVRLPLLNAYYGADEHGADIREPCRTISTRDRFGLVDCTGVLPPMTPAQEQSARKVADFLRKYEVWDGGEFVTLEVDGLLRVIVDIGMRMLTPRELARAQGFGDDYILAAPWRNPKNGRWSNLTETDQRHKIGNSVCPQEAEAHVFANYRPRIRAVETAPQGWMLQDGWDVQPMEAAE